MALQSAHSIRIYELLKQYEKIGSRVFDLDELKLVLVVQELYKRNNDFKRFVIDRAKKELHKHCDITFDYDEIKKGRKIVAVRFYISSKKKDKATVPTAPVEEPLESTKGLALSLSGLGFSEKQIQELQEAHAAEYLQSLISYVQGLTKEKNIKNPAGYLLKLLKENAKPPIKERRSTGNDERKKLALQKQLEKQKQQLIVELQQEFELAWASVETETLKGVSAKGKGSFLNYVRKNPYLRRKFLNESGILDESHPDYQEWFLYFLTPDKDDTFLEWALAQKGYQLQKTYEGGYLLSGKQKKIF